MKLTCEYAVNPLGVDTARPRFGWIVPCERRGQMQSAYRILVASRSDLLETGSADKWDSGKVVANQSVNVPYEGAPLRSGERCFWKVRVWHEGADQYADSPAATFEMGLLTAGDREGQWIGAAATISSPLLRKEFSLPGTITHARAYVCGLGWYELFINGRKAGERVLDPAPTDYDRRALYVTHDVTDMLRPGPNAVGAILGNGSYSAPSALRYGDSPRLWMLLIVQLRDGTTVRRVTDGTWKTSPGPITHNDLYGGETYDARLEKPGWATPGYDDGDWAPATIKQNPGGKLESQLMPPIEVIETIRPRTFTSPQPGVHVFDFGQLFGGWVRLRVKGPAGTVVRIRYSARICPSSGLVDQSHYLKHHRFRALSPSPSETDTYIRKGDRQGETYEPRFTFHPVRYVQVEGLPGTPSVGDLEGRVVHTAVDLSAQFNCSNPLLNRIHQNVRWTLRNSLFGLPLDCLHREPWAWIDPGTVASTVFTRNHMPLFWTKWLRDIRSAQDERGVVPDIAPRYYEKPTADPAWGGNYPMLVWYLHQWYEDKRILEEHFEPVKRWVDHLGSIAVDHIVEQGNWGDHMLPGDAPGHEQAISSETPPPLIWTAYHYRGASIASLIARKLGYGKDEKHYARLARSIARALNRRWLDDGSCRYATGSQTANLLPLAVGIVPPSRLDGLVRNIINSIDDRGGHVHTGNVGTSCLFEALSRHVCARTLYTVATASSYPGWGHMVEQGATTVWEHWGLGDEEDSMMMLASVARFFLDDLAGIRGPDYFGPGRLGEAGEAGETSFDFMHLGIQPYVPDCLEHAGASIRTVRGVIRSNWRKRRDGLCLDVTIPPNCRGRVRIPVSHPQEWVVTESNTEIWRNGLYVSGVAGISGGTAGPDHLTFDVASGSYHFFATGCPTGEQVATN